MSAHQPAILRELSERLGSQKCTRNNRPGFLNLPGELRNRVYINTLEDEPAKGRSKLFILNHQIFEEALTTLHQGPHVIYVRGWNGWPRALHTVDHPSRGKKANMYSDIEVRHMSSMSLEISYMDYSSVFKATYDDFARAEALSRCSWDADCSLESQSSAMEDSWVIEFLKTAAILSPPAWGSGPAVDPGSFGASSNSATKDNLPSPEKWPNYGDPWEPCKGSLAPCLCENKSLEDRSAEWASFQKRHEESAKKDARALKRNLQEVLQALKKSQTMREVRLSLWSCDAGWQFPSRTDFRSPIFECLKPYLKLRPTCQIVADGVQDDHLSAEDIGRGCAVAVWFNNGRQNWLLRTTLKSSRERFETSVVDVRRLFDGRSEDDSFDVALNSQPLPSRFECWTCGQSFESNNNLHQHVRDLEHA